MALELSWSHLTHGHPLSFSGQFYNIVPYQVSKKQRNLIMMS